MRSRYCRLFTICLLAASATSSPAQDVRPALHVESRERELVIEYGPVELPANAGHADTHEPPALVFALPVEGWMRGYAADLIDADGRRVPSALLHHMNLIAKNRRDLFSNVMLRVGSAGPETEAITMPRLLGVRLQRGDTLLMTLMLHNPTATPYAGVRLRVRIPFTPAGSRVGAVAVYPFSIAIGPIGRPNVFDLPPGRSEHYWEGSPSTRVRILGVSGHLHRYGVALRLEDRTSGEVMWEVRPRSDSTGEVQGMPVKLFVWSGGKAMRPDHVYRLTAVYENPEPRTIPDGGMGVLGGIVVLSRRSRWPAVDPRHPEYVADVRSTLGSRGHGELGTRVRPHAHP
ncbi:MAG: hypothetical protein ABR499_20750 [Gemmatimonadaceae bacterium]